MLLRSHDELHIPLLPAPLRQRPQKAAVQGVQAVGRLDQDTTGLLLLTDDGLRISARNKLWGTVSRIVTGPVNAEVTLDLGAGRSATAVVTRDSVDNLGLAEGVRACAAFKASSVILAMLD